MLLLYNSMSISCYQEIYTVILHSFTAQKDSWGMEDKCLSVCFFIFIFFLLKRDTMTKVTYTIKHLNGACLLFQSQHIIIMVERVASGRQWVLEKYLSAHIWSSGSRQKEYGVGFGHLNSHPPHSDTTHNCS